MNKSSIHTSSVITQLQRQELLLRMEYEYEKETFFTDEEIQEYLDNVKLPYKLYDYQENIVKDSLKTGRQINVSCTSSGKSLSIACICDFLRTKNLKGLLLVPNINLLTQFKSDIESYHLTDLLNEVEILGDGNVPTFKKKLLISTWQSLDNHRDKLDFDYLIGDEGHRYSAKVSTDIIKNLIKTKIELKRKKEFRLMGINLKLISNQDFLLMHP